jgi:predicted amidohydrolase
MKIAAISIATVDGLPKSNYLRAMRLMEIALADSPDIVLLPEAFAAGYCGTDLAPFAETRSSAPLRRFRDLSKAGHCMVVLGFLEKSARGIRNAVILFDQGNDIGIHYKRTLWPDAQRPYRDEIALMVPGRDMEVFQTRLGTCAVITCYENMVEENWAEVGPKVDFILSPYNCEDDPSRHNLEKSKRYRVPSAWANRTGTVWAGDRYLPNPGTAGIVDSEGRLVAKSVPGVEEIVAAELFVVAP